MFKGKITPLCDALFSFLGIAGAIGCFMKMYPFPISSIDVYITLLPICIYFFFTFGQTSRKKVLFFIGVFGYCIFAIVTFWIWKEGLLHMINTIFTVYEQNSQFRFHRLNVDTNIMNTSSTLLITFIIICTPICISILRSIREKHSFFLAFLVTMPFMFTIFLFTLRPAVVPFTMLLMFWGVLLGSSLATRYENHSSPSTISQIGLVSAITTLCLSLLISYVIPEEGYVRSSDIEELRSNIQLGMHKYLWNELDSEIGEMDLRTARDRLYIGSVELKVSMNTPQTLYLHGYSGSIYNDNRWMTPKDEEFHRSNTFFNIQELHPFNYANKFFEKGIYQKEDIQITYESSRKDYVYTPYFLLYNVFDSFTPYQDAYIPIEDKDQDTYQFSILSTNGIPKGNRKEANVEYNKVAVKFNSDVPAHLEEVLQGTKIEELAIATTPSDKISAIQSFMQNFGEYTLTPGDTPDEEDFVGYFLETSQKGYCVHYASAAVMLLRYHGIPARYASGYRVDESSFIDGVSEVKDYHAHAWAEILDPVLGWVPLEVTPAASMINPAMNTTSNSMEENQDIISNEQPQVDRKPIEVTPPNEDKNVSNTQHVKHTYEFVYGGLIIFLLLLFGGILVRLHHMRKKRMYHEDSKDAILYCGEYLERYHMVTYPTQIVQILQEAKFSQHPPTEEQRMQMISYCKQVFQEQQKKMPLWKRMVYACAYRVHDHKKVNR